MSVKNILNSFAYDVIDDAKISLIKKKKNDSKRLSNSLDYTLKENKGVFKVSFEMEEHGAFIDKGVSGVGGVKSDGTRWNKKRVVNSPFGYKNKRPPIHVFDKWIVRKGLSPRNAKGQFTTRKGLKFAIANSVYHTGIETTNFFTTSLNRNIKGLADRIIDDFDF